MSRRATADVAAPATSQAITSPSLVGRGGELDGLREALAGGPVVVLIEGEAGIGKSRLLAELWASDRAPRRRLEARCPPFRQPHTLGCLVDALRVSVEGIKELDLSALGGALRPVFPEWADELPPALERPEDATVARHRLFRALGELLGSLDISVLVVEDAHWADDATLEFVQFLTSGPARQLSIVLTSRPEDVPADSLLRRLSSRVPPGVRQVRLPLAPLDVDETARLVSSMLADEPVSDEFAAFVHEHTAGIPFVVEESVRLMQSRAELVRRDGKWLRRRDMSEIVIPHAVRDATLERVGRLGARPQEVLEAAAVLADPSGEALVASVAGLSVDDARVGLVEAMDAGLLAEDDRQRIAFRHALARGAVYESIPPPRRRLVHQNAGRALEGSPPPVAQLFRHFREAGDSERWATYGEAAADLAIASGDERTAAAILHDLVTTADLPAPRLVALTAQIRLGTLDTEMLESLAAVLVRTAEDKSLSPHQRGEIRVELGRVYWFRCDYDRAQAELERAIPSLDGGDPAPLVHALAMLGWPQDSRTRVAEHLGWIRRAEAHADSLDGVDAVSFLVRQTTALLRLGESDGWLLAERLRDDSDEPANRHPIAVGRLNVCDAALTWGRYADADQWLKLTVEIAERHGYSDILSLAEQNELRLDWYRGAWDGLAQRIEGVDVDDIARPDVAAERHLLSGVLTATDGQTVKAEKRLRQSLSQAESTGAADRRAEPAAALGRLLMAEGRSQEALEVSADITDVLVRKEIWLWAADLVPVRVDALVAAGRLDEAASLVRAFAEGMEGRDIPAARAGLRLSEAIVAEARGEPADAASMYAEAAAAWRSLPRPYGALLAEERRARCLVAGGQIEAGVDALRETFRKLSELGARGDADRLRRRLRELDVEVPRHRAGGRPSYGNELSPRELEVVRLVRDGRTNRQIAQTLVLSTQTVAGHVRSAMRKLDVTSRTALAVRALERGVVDNVDVP